MVGIEEAKVQDLWQMRPLELAVERQRWKAADCLGPYRSTEQAYRSAILDRCVDALMETRNCCEAGVSVLAIHRSDYLQSLRL